MEEPFISTITIKMDRALTFNSLCTIQVLIATELIRAMHGGGLYIGSSGIINSSTSLTQCKFINNTANMGSGGAIYELTIERIVNSSVTVVIQCRFINNTASISGGAI